MTKEVSCPSEGDRVLFVRFSSLGDVVLAMKEAKALKERFPHVELWWLCCKEYEGLLLPQPYVDGVIGWDRGEGRLSVFKLVDRIRGMGFKWLYSVHDNDRTALIALLSRIPFRVGRHRHFSFPFHASREEAWSAWGGKTRPLKSLYGDTDRTDALRRDLPPGGLVMCILGTSKPYKTWPVDRWIEMISRLPSDLTAVLTGSGPEESAMAGAIESSVGPGRVVNLVDRLDLLDLVSLCELAACAVGGDTGPMHMAREAGIPCVGLFAVKDPVKCASQEGPNLTTLISPLAVDSYDALKVSADPAAVMGAIDPGEVLSNVIKAVGGAA
ncbi:ADP-heptose:LPS heptosyltransferase [Thermanaerovibrio velox DSM 12556]|uniref:ADP-heptose:LPS heptosyltransferase n=1 Tax=Thermanaerovibrio velox DSM 12556 TaxID=926567 RepID=H0UN32_9BACT|nr:glycosyltransferase family 9 protein [Thermanaerovibrio velox]EHM09311.1 ADP-heptose:LPS heptosyltransferase [Thermanaerovibrio velox DSM 12556]